MRRPGPALVVSIIALVVALSGSAFAANYLITSTKQISPKVLKRLRGPRGRRGKVGSTGAIGAPGPAGSFPAGPLPSGVTIRGEYAASFVASKASQRVYTGISYGYSLASRPAAVVVASGSGPVAHCPGSLDAPAADPGYLCVYRGSGAEENIGTSYDVYTPTNGGDFVHTGSMGAMLDVTANAAGYISIGGSWAVTAP